MVKLKILKINVDVHQHSRLYCVSLCTNNCFTSKVPTDLISISCLNVQTQKINYFKEFQLKQIKYVSQESGIKKIPIVSNKECILQIRIALENQYGFGIATIDTGAQASCISRAYLIKVFGDISFVFNNSSVKLVGPENQTIKCIGTINLILKIGHISIKQEFYCLAEGNCCLLGLPCIKAFNLMIFP